MIDTRQSVNISRQILQGYKFISSGKRCDFGNFEMNDRVMLAPYRFHDGDSGPCCNSTRCKAIRNVLLYKSEGGRW
jgi:hypothetical protein